MRLTVLLLLLGLSPLFLGAEVLLGNVAPLTDPQRKVVDLLDAKRWQEARALAHQQFLLLGVTKEYQPKTMAAQLVLEALADAGLGDESTALCRWYAAQHFDPIFLKADFSRFGGAGALLSRHPALLVAGTDPEALRVTDLAKQDPQGKEVQRPEILSQSPPPVYLDRARRAKVEGKVILGAIIARDGSVYQPGVVRGLPEGLDIAAIEAVCAWRFKPARLNGEPVRMYYNLPITFGPAKKAPASPAIPPP